MISGALASSTASRWIADNFQQWLIALNLGGQPLKETPFLDAIVSKPVLHLWRFLITVINCCAVLEWSNVKVAPLRQIYRLNLGLEL